MTLFEKINSQEKDRRKSKFPEKLTRQRHVAIFDLKKAYDKVNRDLLVAKIIALGIADRDVKMISKCLRNTYMVVEGKIIRTYRGTT